MACHVIQKLKLNRFEKIKPNRKIYASILNA
jgi:hypothetical protein